ncbi:MAG: hypothetical protein FJ304_12195, partial [Planctomycetes bacterium]|nr:hypothetical protein [Planctomycetota bacterium]
MSRFFIDRPIFANVLAIVTVIFGAVALFGLPVERYPPITPPTIQVTATYPGANAKVVAETVAAPIEQQVNGVENMIDSLRNSDRWPIHRVMTNYEKLRRKPLLFRMFTGLSADEFDKV